MTTGTGRTDAGQGHERVQHEEAQIGEAQNDDRQNDDRLNDDRLNEGAQREGSQREGSQNTGAQHEHWNGVEPALLRVRRVVLLCTLSPVAAGLALLLGLTAGPVWTVFALPPLAGVAWGWGALERNWRSWRYAEREDDLLISRGVLWRELTVVPYGRMQLVEVKSGPLERRYGLARLQLHTAAATTDAEIPGLTPEEAERLRDRLTELGGSRSAGL